MERWSGPFANPNLAGLELALLAVAALALAAPAAAGRPLAVRLAAGLVAALAIATLGPTGSRAAVLAFVVGVAVLGAVRAVPWRWALLALALAGGSVIATGTGLRIAGVGTDPSVSDRWVLWRASLALIADHPWRGVGTHELASLLGTWYLPDGYRLRFATALNDVLTCAACWGVPVCALLTGLLAGLIGLATHAARAGSRLAAAAVALAAVHLVSGLFQAHLFAPWPEARWSGGVVLLVLVWSACRSVPLRSAWPALAVACAVPALIGILTCTGDASWRTSRVADGWLVEPRGRVPAGLVVLPLHAEERAAVRDDLAPRLHAADVALLLLPASPQANAWPGILDQPAARGGVLLLAVGDQGLVVWTAWRAGAVPVPVDVVVVDPDGIPPPGAAPRGPLLVVPAESAAIPSPAAIRAAATGDGAAVASGVAQRDWRSVWPPVERWWRRSPSAP